MPKIYIAVQV